jgi:dihydrofolate synthase/folylpolyglutamate synthase
VVIASTQTATQAVFKEKAASQNAPIYFADQLYHLQRTANSNQQFLEIEYTDALGTVQKFQSDLTGIYQLKNITGVLCAIDLLKEKFPKINNEIIASALSKVKSLTGLKGRWEVLSENPLCIADTGHNEDGIQQILTQLTFCEYEQLHWVIGMVNDKDLNAVLALLPKNASYYFCKPNIPRGLDQLILQQAAAQFNLIGECYSSVSEALLAAKNNAKMTDLVLIAGSTFIVAEII